MNKKLFIGLAVFAALAVFLWFSAPLKAATQRFLFGIVSNRGLIGYWDFDECDSCTTAVDRSGNVAAGTFTGGATRISDGKIKNALDLNGSNGYVDVPDSDNWAFGTGDFSISTWVNFDSIRAGGSGSIPNIFVAQDEGGGSTDKWVFFLADSTTVYFHINASGPSAFITGPNISPSTGRWYHIAVTRSEGSSYSFYVDGQLRTTASESQSVPNAAINLTIGQSEGTGYLDGKQDDIRIYNRALSAAEMKYLYQKAATQYTQQSVTRTDLRSHWTFDDCDTCTTVKDYGSANSTGGMYTTCASVSGDLHSTNGYRNNAGFFDGSNDCAEIPDTFNPTEYTIAAWVNTNTTGTQNIFHRSDGNFNSSVSHDIHTTAGNVFEAYTWDGSPNAVTGTTIVQPGQWYFVVTTAKNDDFERLYVDGVEEGTANAVGTLWTGGNDYFIGSSASVGGWGYFSGYIDEVRLYTRAMTATQVRQLFNAEKKKFLSSANQTKFLQSGLIGYWPFNGPDVSGATAFDRSGFGNNGTISGATTDPGIVGQALQFDGVDDRITMGDVVEPNNITITAWFKTDRLAINRNIVSKWGDSTGTEQQYILATDDGSADKITFAVGNGGSLDVCDSTGAAGTYKAGEWFFAAGTYDGTDCTVYLNAVNVNSFALNGISGNIANMATDLRIGVRGDDGTSDIFDGYIDEVRIYNRALTPAELVSIYQAGRKD